MFVSDDTIFLDLNGRLQQKNAEEKIAHKGDFSAGEFAREYIPSILYLSVVLVRKNE